MKGKIKVVIVLLAAGGFLSACSSGSNDEGSGTQGTPSHQEGSSPQGVISLGGEVSSGSGGQAADHPDTSAIQKIKRSIFVPAEVAGKWKAVTLSVTDNTGSLNEVKTITLGDEFTITGSSINVSVQEFLPHLSIGESSFTSLSNDTINAAIHLVITENGKLLFDGWAYKNFPKMYHFRHEKYAVTLVDFIPAG